MRVFGTDAPTDRLERATVEYLRVVEAPGGVEQGAGTLPPAQEQRAQALAGQHRPGVAIAVP